MLTRGCERNRINGFKTEDGMKKIIISLLRSVLYKILTQLDRLVAGRLQSLVGA